jgi:hypothetical protein
MFIKCMVYTANKAVFPLHRGGVLHQNLFRVYSISLSKCMPDFAMCYENTKNVFEIVRGFLTAVMWLDRATIRFRVLRHCQTCTGSFCVFGPVLSSPAHGSPSLPMAQIENVIF